MISMAEDARNIARAGGWFIEKKPTRQPPIIRDRSDEVLAMIKRGIDTRIELTGFFKEREVSAALPLLQATGRIGRSRRNGYLIWVAS